jgi:hypothetical protein
MKHTLLDEFTSLVEKYERGLDPCQDEDAIRAVDDMADWVKDNLDALDCDSIEDIFDEYEEMQLYMNGGYEDDFYPDGNDGDEDGYSEDAGDGDEDRFEAYEDEGDEAESIWKFRRFCRRMRPSEEIIGSGFPLLDSITGGFRPGELTVIASRPVAGKTGFALDIAKNVAMDGGRPVLLFSLQLDSHSAAERLLTAVCGSDWQQMDSEKCDNLYDSQLWLDDTPALHMEEFKEKAEDAVKVKGVRLIIIDYLQLLNGHNEVSMESREEEVADIVVSLKQTAQDLNVPIIVLSQLKRNMPGGHRKPEAGDLPSAAIGDNADVVMFIGCPKETDLGWETRTVSVAKNVNGACGEVAFRLHGGSFSQWYLIHK